MRAVTVRPGHPGSLRVTDVPDPQPAPAELLVQGLAIGVCGTDHEIAEGHFGQAPSGQDHLVLGHESLGEVLTAPQGSAFAPGDLVAGVVRRPDPVPCGACGAGEFDMCRNGRYTERGIKGADGYGSDLWTVDPAYAVRLDSRLFRAGVLLEPASIVTKAWEQIERAGQRSWFEPRRVLVTGAGPIGLLAALLGHRRGLDVHVLDRVTKGPKPKLVEALGATYHHDPAADVLKRLEPDVVIEATGAGEVIFDAISGMGAYGIVCLTGVSQAGHELRVDAGEINRRLVLGNGLVLGSVNGNLRHYRAAADTLAETDLALLESIITRRVPLKRAEEAFTPAEDDVKVVLALSDHD